MSGFDPEAVRRAVEAHVAALPADKRGQLVAHVGPDGPALSLVTRVNGVWSIEAEAFKPWHGPFEGHLDVVASW